QEPLERGPPRVRRQPEADGAGRGLMAADRAAHAEVVSVHERAVDLDLLALEAEVGDPVLPAAVRAAGDVDPEMLLEPGQALLERLDEAAGEALRLGERQLAELGT